MGAIVSARGLYSRDGRLALSSGQVEPGNMGVGVQGEAQVFVYRADLLFKSRAEHFRPYLDMQGEVRSIRGSFPGGVSEIKFSQERGTCPKVAYQYDFDDSELSEMCLKGLYNNEFTTPDIFNENMFELPVSVTAAVIRDNDVPVVFADIEDAMSMSISHETCGYRLGDYFEAVQPQAEPYYDMDYEYDEASLADFDSQYGDKLGQSFESADNREYEEPEELTEEEIRVRRVSREISEKVDEMARQRELAKQTDNKKLEGKTTEELEKAAEAGSIDNANEQKRIDESEGLPVEDISVTPEGSAVYGDGSGPNAAELAEHERYSRRRPGSKKPRPITPAMQEVLEDIRSQEPAQPAGPDMQGFF